jgi:hypothetical protein
LDDVGPTMLDPFKQALRHFLRCIWQRFEVFSNLNLTQWQEFQVLFCLKTDNLKELGPLS